jgi:hypothetical protein
VSFVLTLMYAPVHVMCMCAERSFYWNMEFTARTSLNIPKHLPEKIGLDSEILSIPSPRVEDGRIYPGETGFHWYANFPGNTEKVTFQYVVDVVENDDISTPWPLFQECAAILVRLSETIRLPLMDSV